ncbi:MAG TPA: hypothetical protein VFY89_10630, partial [Ktedonobacterales bacterium]
MSTNSHTPAAAPVPGPRCAAYQPLLPIWRAGDVEAPTAEELGAHLATCAYCRAELAAYDALDARLRRHFAPPPAAGAPDALATADLLAMLGLDDLHDLHDLHDLDHHATPERGTTSPRAATAAASTAHPQRLRTTLSGVGSLAAVLLIAVLAQLLFASHGRPSVPGRTGSQVGPGDPGGTPTPTVIAVTPGTYQALSAISMVSPEEGWAAGVATNYAVKNAPWSTLLYHYHQGQWTSEQAPNVGMVTAIQMLSPTDGWITGQQGLLRYDGASWQPVSLGPLTMSNFGPLQMLSADDGWLVVNGNTLLRYQND